MALRALITMVGFLAAWHLLVWFTQAEPYILPSPDRVLERWWQDIELISGHAAVTFVEIVLGLVIGCLLGVLTGLVMARYRLARLWLLPAMVISQALPVFAIAPVLVLWIGYGMGSKITMAVIIIYFPVTAAFYDGLRRTEPGWLDLAATMGASKRSEFWVLRIPAALPALASGIRVATAIAPIGAVIGEWVGSSRGLGFLMLHSNGRMQTDLMFAALFTLAVFAVLLYTVVDAGLRRLTYWQTES
ncbi:MAG: ABC transporter permease subunit [Gammaproteobacteria bacterium]|nr:ABC transporter permease subunit [Gammaproteobacteria bacterium]